MEMANELNGFKNDITAFGDALARVEGNYKKAFQEILSLNAMWEGPAHDAFEVSFRQDNATVEDAVKFLQKYKSDLDMALSEYQKCEMNVDNLVRAIKV